MNTLKSFLATTLFSVSAFSTASADIIDFGGKPEKFSGRGDRIPPQCQVNSPNAAGAPFNILWNCEDEDAAQPDIRTEIWILRKGESAWERAQSFLGFPAALQVSAEILKAPTVREGLPATFRVVGMDRAGNATFSPAFTVNPGASESLACRLEITTDLVETDPSGSTTGIPSRSVILGGIATEAISQSTTAFTLNGTSVSAAETCEIDALCVDEGVVSFAGNGVVSGGTSAQVQFSASPGGLSALLTGSVVQSSTSNTLTSVSLTGAGTVDEEPVNISLTCSGGAGETSDGQVLDGASTSETVTEGQSAAITSPNFEPL